MNFALELFLASLAMIYFIVIVTELVVWLRSLLKGKG